MPGGDADMRMRRLLIAGLAALAVVAFGPGPTVGAGTANAQAPSAAKTKISPKELQAFARAAREVFRVRQAYAPKVQSAKSEIGARDFIVAAEKEMGEAIGRQGLTVARYNEILKAAQRDPSLAARIQALVDRDAAGDAAGAAAGK
jgi:Domain of unknown function (DUF4168)